METIQRECHTLKSALGQMAAIQAATHARTLEAAAREKLPLSDLRIIYEALTLEWSEVQKAWIKVLGEFS
jgi:HPt (histidine-containing phosphotransfer) domain-containing protein